MPPDLSKSVNQLSAAQAGPELTRVRRTIATRPTAPSSTVCLARAYCGKKRTTCAGSKITPAARQAAIISAACWGVRASGFSQTMCLPAAAALSAMP